MTAQAAPARGAVPIRVAVVDDQQLVRVGLRMVLGARPEVDIVGEAADGAAALELAERERPDVVLMDVRMPGMDGIEATRLIRERLGSRADGAPGVLVLTTFDLDEHAFEALRAGAGGFLAKDAPIEQLVVAINAVHRGDAVVGPGVTRQLVEHFVAARSGCGPNAGGTCPVEGLTPRENEVLVLIASGRSNAEIAAELVVSEVTVKTHVGRILSKLGLRDRTQAVVYAYENGVVQAGA